MLSSYREVAAAKEKMVEDLGLITRSLNIYRFIPIRNDLLFKLLILTPFIVKINLLRIEVITLCGRFTLSAEWNEIIDRFAIEAAIQEELYHPSYNVAPSQPVLAIINDGNRID